MAVSNAPSMPGQNNFPLFRAKLVDEFKSYDVMPKSRDVFRRDLIAARTRFAFCGFDNPLSACDLNLKLMAATLTL
jgi:hypothetical protein